MSVFDLEELAPLEPTNTQKVKFRRAVMAGVGRTSLDPQLKVFTDRDGYGAITKETVRGAAGKHALHETQVYLGTDGVISVDFSVEAAEQGLARAIQAGIAEREHAEAIKAYCAETGKTRKDAERVIFGYMLTTPTGIEAAVRLVEHIDTLGQAEESSAHSIDAFAFGDLTDRIVRSFVAL